MVSRPKVVDSSDADDNPAAITQRQPGGGEEAASATAVGTTKQTTPSDAALLSTEEVEMVEEWKWEGVWAFGSLPNNQEEIDKLLNPLFLMFFLLQMYPKSSSLSIFCGMMLLLSLPLQFCLTDRR